MRCSAQLTALRMLFVLFSFPAAVYLRVAVTRSTEQTTLSVPEARWNISEAYPILGSEPSPILVDDFSTGELTNNLGFWHGGDPSLRIQYGPGSLLITPHDVALSYYTRISNTCKDTAGLHDKSVHIQFEGSTSFSVGLQQHNPQCNDAIAPYPETWDEVEASTYARGNHIFIPMSHFQIDKSRTIGFALRSFWSSQPTLFRKIEIVDTSMAGTWPAEPLPTSKLLFACTRPNSFALAIDDGSPALAQEVMEIIKAEAIPVTFFAVGNALLDEPANFSNVYREMRSLGHQIALHSWSHPDMESLASYDEIDSQYQRNIDAYRQVFGAESKYFRPPYGTVGARMRHRLAAINPGTKIINWDIDVEDYKWAATETPEKQLDAFKRDIARGGNLVVSHYLSASTVGYFREFIRLAKATGKQLMRVDQCMEDPEAPSLS